MPGVDNPAGTSGFGGATLAQPASPASNRSRAAALAKRMPLVHFPASARFEAWVTWPEGLKSRAALGRPMDPGDFGELRGRHVFLYAGPSCYFNAHCIGNSAVYFDPSVEGGREGEATPFDSGSLEDPTPKLRPWKDRSVGERWEFLRRSTVPLSEFRAKLEAWLSASYDNPDRYLESGPNRYHAGLPDRLDPPEILEENNGKGFERHGADCADRRAWTWEVRIAWALPFEKVRALHVPFYALERALDVADKMRWSSGFAPEVETLPPDIPASFEEIYRGSGPLLQRLIGP